MPSAATETSRMTASQILAIPADRPERLFVRGGRDELAADFRKLAMRWHPDRNGGSAESTEVFARIVALHEAAGRRVASGAAAAPAADAVRISTLDGRAFDLSYRVRRPFELGETTVSATKLGFFVKSEHGALFDAGVAALRDIRFPDARVRAQMERFFPAPRGVYETATHKVAVFDKTEDVVVLSDLIAHMGGALPPKHAAWVVSSLLNWCCFLEISGLTHNAISPGTVLVTPTHHAAFSLSFWYAARKGESLNVLPPETFELVPADMARTKKASIRLDLESVRAVGRACLGDPSGASLGARADVPRSVSDFLRLPAADSAIADYRAWSEKALPGFGPRRFLKLEITSRDVYR